MTGLPFTPYTIYHYARGRCLSQAEANQLMLNLTPWVFASNCTAQVHAARYAILAATRRSK